jgi:hypothetical protein
VQVGDEENAGLPREKIRLRGFHILLSMRARSFDCGSGEFLGEEKRHGSPSLRMTDF